MRGDDLLVLLGDEFEDERIAAAHGRMYVPERRSECWHAACP